MHQQQTAFENIVGKEEIACNNAFPTMLSTQSDNCIPFVHNFDIISLYSAESEESKIAI